MMELFRDYLITDRTLSDIARVQYLKDLWDPVRRRWTGTQEELEEWESGPKGAYNAKDLNRVTLLASYVLTRWLESGYRLPVEVFPAHLAAVSVDPPGSGTAGSVFFYDGDPVTVLAKPVGASRFLYWTENGETVSREPEYTFTAHADRTLTAHFAADWLFDTSIVGVGIIGTAILGRGFNDGIRPA